MLDRESGNGGGWRIPLKDQVHPPIHNFTIDFVDQTYRSRLGKAQGGRKNKNAENTT